MSFVNLALSLQNEDLSQMLELLEETNSGTIVILIFKESTADFIAVFIII